MLNRDEWVVPLFYSSKPRFTHRASAAICRTVIRWPTHQLSLCGAACRNEPAAVWLGDHRGRDDGALTAPVRSLPSGRVEQPTQSLTAPARDRTFTRYSIVRSALFGTSSRSAGSTFPVVGATSAHAANARSCVTMLHDQNIAPAINVIHIMHVDNRPLGFNYFLQRKCCCVQTLCDAAAFYRFYKVICKQLSDPLPQGLMHGIPTSSKRWRYSTIKYMPIVEGFYPLNKTLIVRWFLDFVFFH